MELGDVIERDLDRTDLAEGGEMGVEGLRGDALGEVAQVDCCFLVVHFYKRWMRGYYYYKGEEITGLLWIII